MKNAFRIFLTLFLLFAASDLRAQKVTDYTETDTPLNDDVFYLIRSGADYQITYEYLIAPAKDYADGKISDDAYDESGWDGVTTIGPSKNAVRDKFAGLSLLYQPKSAVLDAWAGKAPPGTYTPGDIWYIDGDGNLARLPKGPVNSVLSIKYNLSLGWSTSVAMSYHPNPEDDEENESHTGETIPVTAGENISRGQLCYARHDGSGSNKAYLYDGNGTYRGRRQLFLATETISSGSTINLLVRGTLKNTAWGWTTSQDEGKTVYASTTPGGLSIAAPSIPTVAVGTVLEEHTIFFNPPAPKPFKLHHVQVTVVKPQDLADAVRDAFLFWSNETDTAFTITQIKCWAGTDDATLTVKETDADGANAATVDALECATNGTGVYTDTQTTITGPTIEAGHLLWIDFDDTDDPSFVKLTVSGYFDSAVD